MTPKIYGFTSRNGYRCVDVLLHDMATTESIYWSDRKNSYVLTEPMDGEDQLTLPDGQAVRLVSVNGIGEVRWEAMSYQLSGILERAPTPGSDAHEVWCAARHLKLPYGGKELWCGAGSRWRSSSRSRPRTMRRPS